MSQLTTASMSEKFSQPTPLSHQLLGKLLDRQVATKTGLFYVFQWKEQLDEHSPAWKKLFFRWVYRPFNQLCRFRLGLPTFNGQYQDGRLCWVEHQGIVSEKWMAEQAAQTANWGYHLLPLDSLLPEQTTTTCTDHNYPLTDLKAQKKYTSNGNGTIPVGRLDLAKLASKIASSDAIVERYHSKVT